jgi:hypothetical protein
MNLTNLACSVLVRMLLAVAAVLTAWGTAAAQFQCPPPQEVPRDRVVLWDFEESEVGNMALSFGVHMGQPPSDPMMGKLELAYDLASDYDHEIAQVERSGDPANKVLVMDGDKVTFHADRPFTGTISVWFKEDPEGGDYPWGLTAGGVMFGPLADYYPDTHYSVRFGSAWYFPDHADPPDQQILTDLERDHDWHKVEWRTTFAADVIHPDEHRYIELWFDGILIARHGFPSKLHSLSFVHWWGTPDLFRVYLDDIKFTEEGRGESCKMTIFSPEPLLAGGACGGLSTDQFEVISAYHFLGGIPGTYEFCVDVCPAVAEAIRTSPSDYHLLVWATPITCPTTGQTGEVQVASYVLDGTQGPFMEDIPMTGGWWRIHFPLEGNYDFYTDLDYPGMPPPGVYWFTCAVTRDPTMTRDQARRPLVPDNPPPLGNFGFDERVVVIQGATIGNFRFNPHTVIYHPYAPPPFWDEYEVQRADLCSVPTELVHGGVLVVLPPGGASPYVQAGSSWLDNFGYWIHVPDANLGKLHRVIIEYPVNTPRDMVFSVTEVHGTPPDAQHSAREPVSVNVMVSGDLVKSTELGASPGKPVIPTQGDGIAERTLYIYPGGDLLVVAMTHTAGMPAAIRSIRVDVEGDLPLTDPGPPLTGTVQAKNAGVYFESPSGLRNTFGIFPDASAHPELAVYDDWSPAPTVWDLPGRYVAVRNWMRYQAFVNFQMGGQGILNQLAFDVVYYREPQFVSGAFERFNWEMEPGQEVGPGTPKFHGPRVPGNKWGDTQYYFTTSKTPICDFDFAAFTAAVCQGEGVKLLPVIDLYGTAELDYMNYPALYTGNPNAGGGLNGWNTVDVAGHQDTDPDQPTFLNIVSMNGQVHCGFGEPDLPEGKGLVPGGQLRSYNPINPKVRDVILEMAEDLGNSLRPFAVGSNYLGGSEFAPVESVALLMNERTRTTLMAHSRSGHVSDDGNGVNTDFLGGPDRYYWLQSDWSYDDNTWAQFMNSAYGLQRGVEFDPSVQKGGTRFERRWVFLTDPDENPSQVVDLEAYRDFRRDQLGSLYQGVLSGFSGGYSEPKLTLLYLAPSKPGIEEEYSPEWSDPTYVRSYLEDGIALAQQIHQGMGAYQDRVVYIAPNWSMYNTRWQHGQMPNGQDDLWIRTRWFDYSSETEGTAPDTYRDYTGDSYFPDSIIANGTVTQTGGMVYHQFIEPFCGRGYQYRHGWGYGEDEYGMPWIATNAEPGDVAVSWDPGYHPVFSGFSGPRSAPAWAVPYSSVYYYFISTFNPTGQNKVNQLLFGGWDTTALYGHEFELYRALSGQY